VRVSSLCYSAATARSCQLETYSEEFVLCVYVNTVRVDDHVCELHRLEEDRVVIAVGSSLAVDHCVRRLTQYCLVKNVLTSRSNLPPGRSRHRVPPKLR
jgi:hypothetical protein